MKSNAMNVNNIFKNSLTNNSYYKYPSGKLSVNTTSTVKKENKEINVKSDSSKNSEFVNNTNKENKKNAFIIMNDYIYQRSKGNNNVFSTNNISSKNNKNKFKEIKTKSKEKRNNSMESFIDSNRSNDYYQYGHNYLAEQNNNNAPHYDIRNYYDFNINNNIDFSVKNNSFDNNNEDNLTNIREVRSDKKNINGINKIDCIDANRLINNNITRCIVKKNYSINRKFPRNSINNNDKEKILNENYRNSNNINIPYLSDIERSSVNTVNKNNNNLPVNRNRSVHLDNRSSINSFDFDYNNNNSNLIDSLLKITYDTSIKNVNSNFSIKTNYDRNSIDSINKKNDLINNKNDIRIVRDSHVSVNRNDNFNRNNFIINDHNLTNSTSINTNIKNQYTRTNLNNPNNNIQNNETGISRSNNNVYNNIYNYIYDVEEFYSINSQIRNYNEYRNQIANRLINYNDYNDNSYNDNSYNDDIRVDSEDLYSISNIDINQISLSMNSIIDSFSNLINPTNHETKGFSESEIKLIPARKFANDLKQDRYVNINIIILLTYLYYSYYLFIIKLLYSCVICMEAIILNEDIRIFSCNHFFHIKCIDSWLLKKRNCPLCKKSISLHK